MIEDTTNTSCGMVSKVARGMLEEAISKTSTSLVFKGKILTAVRFVTLQGAGSVLLPNNMDTRSVRPVIDMLRQKHPALIVPDVEVLEHYNIVSEVIPLDITEDTVE